MDGGLVDYVAGGLVVVVSAYQLWTSRAEHHAVLRQLDVAFLCLGLGLVAMPHEVGRFLDMLAAAYLDLAAYAVRTPNRLRVARWWVLVMAVVVGIGMVAVGRTRFADSVFFGFVGVCLVMFVVLVRRYLRGGPRVLMAAASVGVGWAVWGGVRPWLGLAGAVGTGLGLLSILLWLWGATLIAWRLWSGGPLHAYVACRRLRPLWAALHNGPAHSYAHRAHFALYRRLIEIRDGQLALRAHLPPTATDWATTAAAGISDETTRAAVIEATKIAAALAAREANAASRSQPEPTLDAPDAHVDLAAETAWLLAVTKAFTTSPIPAMARQRFGVTATTPE